MRKLHFLIENETEIIALRIRIKCLSHTFFVHRGVMMHMENSIFIFVFFTIPVQNHKFHV